MIVRVIQAVDPKPWAPEREAVPILRFSTSDLPPAERYAAWLERGWPRPDSIFRTKPSEPFNTSWESAQLGPVTFVRTEITGMSWERRLGDIRVSDFDPIVISMMVEGYAHGDMDGRAFRETAGTFHISDLARPSLHVSTASRTYNLIIGRSVALECLSRLDDLHGLVIDGDAAEMLFSHAAQVQRMLPRLRLADADRLGRVFLDLVAVAVGDARPNHTVRSRPADILRARAVEEIERQLGNREVSIADLGRALGVSRARLFAAFRPDGGVQTYITAERLSRARAALFDVNRAEPVGNIAHRLGFSDAPHLSRAFRQRYGMTPTEYRRLVASAPGAGPAPALADDR